MDYQPIQSGNLEGAKYDASKKLLTVKFKGSGEYEYSDVPQGVWNKFQATFQTEDSTGKFFHQHIKKFSYQKLENKS